MEPGTILYVKFTGLPGRDTIRRVHRVTVAARAVGRMMAVFVEVFGAFGLTISRNKTETMHMPIPRAPAKQIVSNATEQ